jgi:hypothetical protein
MSSVGTIIRDPGVVQLSVGATSVIVRGNAVSMDPATKLARIAQTADSVYGIATSDADTDLGYVALAVRGGYTVAIKPASAVTFAIGDKVYYDAAGQSGNFTNAAGTGQGAIVIGWVVDKNVDAQGCVEMAYMTI